MYTVEEWMTYKMTDLLNLAKFLGLERIGGEKKKDLAQRIYNYYHPQPQEMGNIETVEVERSVRVQRIYDSSKE